MTTAMRGVPVRDFPPPPTVLFKGSAIVPTPSPLEDLDDFDGFVPDVIGDKYLRAESELRRSGYASQSVEGCDRSGEFDGREVYAQDPAPGTAAPAGTVVTLTYQSERCEEQ